MQQVQETSAQSTVSSCRSVRPSPILSQVPGKITPVKLFRSNFKMLLTVRSLMAKDGKVPENLLPSSFKMLSVAPNSDTKSDNPPVKSLLLRSISSRAGRVNISSGIPPEMVVPVIRSLTKELAWPMADEIVPRSC